MASAAAKTSIVTPIRTTVYAAKLGRLAGVYISLRLTCSLFEASYVSAVYGRGEEPPRMVTINIALFTCLALVTCTMWLLMYAGGVGASQSTPNLGFASEVLSYLLRESVAYSILILLAGLYISHTVSRKRYFRYKTDGLRAIRAFQSLMLAVIVPIGLLPFTFAL